MELYVCQVSTGEEQKYLNLFRARNAGLSDQLQFHIPQRQLRIRRRGKLGLEKQKLFPGYVFVEMESPEPAYLDAMRKTPGFFRLLPETASPRALEADSKDMINRLINRGEVLGISTVKFSEQGRIQVIRGPMEGLEGRIVKIDRRKQRARIRLDLYDNSHLIDLGFEELEARDEEPSPPSPPSADDKRSPQQVSGGDRAWTAELAAKAGSDAGKHGTK